MKPDLRFGALLACFFLSGAAALLFQVAWTREFAFVFGTSELAIATVLAAYMGGLAAGAGLAERYLPRLARPLLCYALLEAGIGASALAVPFAIRGAIRLVVALFGGQVEIPSSGGLSVALFYTGASLAILALPTLCMGATLPVLARVAVRSDAEIAPRVGRLYAVNTLGAVLGAFCAAFWLLPALGLRQTVWCGVALNALVTAAALGLFRAARDDSERTRAEVHAAVMPDGHELPALARAARWIPLLLFASGVASFSYELLWTRLLAHLFGGSLFSFATMLASFLLGIAAGSALATRVAGDRFSALRALAIAEIAIALASTGIFAALDALPAVAAALGTGRASHLANASVALAVLLPAALGIGATFPLAVRALAPSAARVGEATARIYRWNTAGAIVGSLATGFALLPALGFTGVLRAAAGLNLAIALALLALTPFAQRAARASLVGCAIGTALLCAAVDAPWKLLGASPFDLRAVAEPPLYFGVGRSATIAAVATRTGALELRSNGLKESELRRPGEVETLSYAWLAGLPAMLRPDAEQVLAVGLGGAGMLERLPASFERVDVVEIEPEVLHANRALAPLRAVDPLGDAHLHIALNDVRGALLLCERRFEVVISQPSHPWTEGASHLYTREFAELVKQRLTPGGLFVQWIGVSFLDEDLLRGALATLLGVFEHVQVYLPFPYGELYFAASDAPIDWRAGASRFVATEPEQAARFGVAGPEDLFAVLRLDTDSARELAAGTPPIRDDRNRFQFQVAGRPGRVHALLRGRVPDSLAAGLDRAYLARRLLAAGERERALRFDPRAMEPPAELPAVVARALALGDAARFAELSELDAELARIDLRSPHHPAAVQLRMRWRVESREPARAREAAAIAEPLLGVANRVEPFFWRAQALALAGEADAALNALAQIARQLGNRRQRERSPALRAEIGPLAADTLALLPNTGELGLRRRALAARFDSLLAHTR
jgi:spermidine synthase